MNAFHVHARRSTLSVMSLYALALLALPPALASLL